MSENVTGDKKEGKRVEKLSLLRISNTPAPGIPGQMIDDDDKPEFITSQQQPWRTLVILQIRQ
jgi:hypothetical protein